MNPKGRVRRAWGVVGSSLNYRGVVGRSLNYRGMVGRGGCVVDRGCRGSSHEGEGDECLEGMGDVWLEDGG